MSCFVFLPKENMCKFNLCSFSEFCSINGTNSSMAMPPFAMVATTASATGCRERLEVGRGGPFVVRWLRSKGVF